MSIESNDSIYIKGFADKEKVVKARDDGSIQIPAFARTEMDDGKSTVDTPIWIIVYPTGKADITLRGGA